MRILIVSDAWLPHTAGIVRTLQSVAREMTARGHTVEVIGPERFRTVPLPTYPDIRIAVWPGRRLGQLIEAFAPDALHIATEGPLGWAARAFCMRRSWPFTTSYATRFPEYIKERFPIPLSWSYGVLRRFHRPSAAVMVATPSIERELAEHGFANMKRWGRGVDVDLFHPRDKGYLPHPRPILMYVGRVAVEKNIEAFLRLPTTGTKVVVGDGPQRAELERRHPGAVFVGAKFGEELACHYAAGDVFVFPSRTDTFGLVMLESLASGVPVAAYPVPGPRDVLDAGVGALDEDLSAAVDRALGLPAEACRRFALEFSWAKSAEQFLANLAPIPRPLPT